MLGRRPSTTGCSDDPDTGHYLTLAKTTHIESAGWRRNVYAVTAASFMGYTGFTLVMPFLPLFIRELGVSDVGRVAMWTGISLGITPALTALLAPATIFVVCLIQ